MSTRTGQAASAYRGVVLDKALWDMLFTAAVNLMEVDWLVVKRPIAPGSIGTNCFDSGLYPGLGLHPGPSFCQNRSLMVIL